MRQFYCFDTKTIVTIEIGIRGGFHQGGGDVIGTKLFHELGANLKKIDTKLHGKNFVQNFAGIYIVHFDHFDPSF